MLISDLIETYSSKGGDAFLKFLSKHNFDKYYNRIYSLRNKTLLIPDKNVIEELEKMASSKDAKVKEHLESNIACMTILGAFSPKELADGQWKRGLELRNIKFQSSGNKLTVADSSVEVEHIETLSDGDELRIELYKIKGVIPEASYNVKKMDKAGAISRSHVEMSTFTKSPTRISIINALKVNANKFNVSFWYQKLGEIYQILACSEYTLPASVAPCPPISQLFYILKPGHIEISRKLMEILAGGFSLFEKPYDIIAKHLYSPKSVPNCEDWQKKRGEARNKLKDSKQQSEFLDEYKKVCDDAESALSLLLLHYCSFLEMEEDHSKMYVKGGTTHILNIINTILTSKKITSISGEFVKSGWFMATILPEHMHKGESTYDSSVHSMFRRYHESMEKPNAYRIRGEYCKGLALVAEWWHKLPTDITQIKPDTFRQKNLMLGNIPSFSIGGVYTHEYD